MKFKFLFSTLLLTILFINLKAQSVISDAVYVKDNSVKYEPNAFLLKYYLPELLDTSLRNKLNENIAAINLNSAKPPLQFDDCIYFNDVMQHCFKERGERFIWNNLFVEKMYPSRFPPSLRFSTDGTKNYIDSLYNIHLYPKVLLEEYAQPFYFKKSEVTNGEYAAFVNYVKDSVARRILAKNGFEDDYLLTEEDLLKSHRYTDETMPDETDQSHWPLNMKEAVHWDATGSDYKEALQEIYIPVEERFFGRKEIDTRKLIYEYYSDSLGNPIPFSLEESAKTDKNRFKNVINVYPDTLSWLNDFPFSNFESMSNLYFWHPAFADFPVVGISYNQAKAFLNWKTIQEQKKLDAKGIKLKIVYDLPSEIEWEIAATTEMTDGKLNSYGKNFQELADNSWLTDLMLDSSAFINQKIKIVVDSTIEEVVPEKYSDFGESRILSPGNSTLPVYYYTDTIIEKNGKQFRIKTKYFYRTSRRPDFLNDNLTGKDHYDYYYSPDFYRFTAPADLHKVKKTTEVKYEDWMYAVEEKTKEFTVDNTEILKQLDGNGISFMGGNVSEWLKEDYSDWLPAFLMRSQLLHSIQTPDAQLEYQREFYYNTLNAKNGKLVRGANWFDERCGNMLGKNPAGTSPKIFVDPSKSHCTLGFRYVVHVTRK